MIDPRIAAFKTEADKVLQHLKGEYSKLQTGRANAALVEHIEVEAYGQRQQLRAVAGVSVPESRTITVQPWDRSIMQAIEKALQMANIGASPVNDGTVIRLNFPQMNEERRQQITKIVHQLAEESRIALRQHRQKFHDEIKADKDEDVRATQLEVLQKEVDAMNAQIAELAKKKEEEVMKV